MILADILARAEQTGQAADREIASLQLVEAIVEHGMGRIRQDLAAATRIAASARRTAKLIRDSRAIGLSERLSGHCRLLAGKAKGAVIHYERAREAFAGQPDERAGTAVAMLQALAYVGDYQRAFEIGQEALATFQALGDPTRAARVRANIANALHRLDRLTEAKAEYEAALPVLAEAQLLADLAIVMRNYGVCLMGLQQFETADGMYARARSAFEAAGQRSLVLEIDLNRAYLLGRTGRLREALTAYRRLREALPAELGYELGHALLDQADLMLEAGLWTDAEQAAARASEVFAALSARFELGKARLLQGQAQLRLGQDTAARQCLAEARRRLRREPNQTWHALSHSATAELHERAGKPKAAFRALEQALASGPGPERVALIRDRWASLALDLDPTHSVETHSPAIRVKQARLNGHQKEAEQWARQALAEFDSRRGALESASLRRAGASAHQRALRECFRALQDPAERLGVVTRMKDQALAELAYSPESFVGGEEIESLRVRLDALPPEHRAPAEIELEARWRAAQHERTVAALSPETLPAIPSDTRFIEFFADQGELFAFTVGPLGVLEQSLGPAEPYETQSRMLRFHLGRRQDPRGALRSLAWFGDKLGETLSRAPRVVIGRGSPLTGTPLHAILMDDQALLERVEVAYAPSAAAWTAVRARASEPGTGPLILGAPDAHAPQIAQEVELVSELLAVPSTPLERLDELAPCATLLHLAAHGIVREDRPTFTSLSLGDRQWTVFDVLRSRLRAQMVVLSGCSTGVAVPGESGDAEGFIEALLTSGTRAVLASLWEVSDDAALEWMTCFYREARTRSAGLAYRAACQQLRAQRAHPADWAAFACFGDFWNPGVSNALRPAPLVREAT